MSIWQSICRFSPVRSRRHPGSPRRHGLAALALMPVCLLMMGADRGCVHAPPTDTIVVANPTVSGFIVEYDSAGNAIGLRDGLAGPTVNGVWYGWTSTVDQVWTYPDLPMNDGVNLIAGITARNVGRFQWVFGDIPQFIYEKKTDLPNRGQQQVFLDWSASGIDDKLRAMAVATLNGPLSDADQDTFVAGVKARVASFFAQAYSGVNVVLVDAPGPDVHYVLIHGEDSCALYGQSPGDYKNQSKAQLTDIYVGTFKCVVVDENELLTSTPALLTDSLDTRINDIGTFIGRTVAHEVGHSLGLVAEPDLHGCEGWHNCEAYDDSNPADRFDTGHHIMDPGPKSPVYARIGQANPSGPRSSQDPYFEAYGKSYLAIIHP
jgi:hypothetical protein